MFDEVSLPLLAGLGIPILVFVATICYHFIYPNPQKQVPPVRRKKRS